MMVELMTSATRHASRLARRASLSFPPAMLSTHGGLATPAPSSEYDVPSSPTHKGPQHRYDLATPPPSSPTAATKRALATTPSPVHAIGVSPTKRAPPPPCASPDAYIEDQHIARPVHPARLHTYLCRGTMPPVGADVLGLAWHAHVHGHEATRPAVAAPECEACESRACARSVGPLLIA